MVSCLVEHGNCECRALLKWIRRKQRAVGSNLNWNNQYSEKPPTVGIPQWPKHLLRDASLRFYISSSPWISHRPLTLRHQSLNMLHKVFPGKSSLTYNAVAISVYLSQIWMILWLVSVCCFFCWYWVTFFHLFSCLIIFYCILNSVIPHEFYYIFLNNTDYSWSPHVVSALLNISWNLCLILLSYCWLLLERFKDELGLWAKFIYGFLRALMASSFVRFCTSFPIMSSSPN